MTRLLTAACVLALLAACGQKGPLYLPDKAAQAVPATPQASPAPADPATTPRRRLP